MTFFTAILTALPQILKLLMLIGTMIHDAEQRGLGRAEAVKEALENAHRDIAAGDAAEELARADHVAKPDSDDAFNVDFRRPDQ